MKIVSGWEEYRRNRFRRWDKEAEAWVTMMINPLWRVYSQGKNMKEADKALESAIELYLLNSGINRPEKSTGAKEGTVDE